MNISSTDPHGVTPTPALTAVVVAFTGGTVLGRGLAALQAQAGASPIEIVVVFDGEGPCAPFVANLRNQYPGVRWLPAAAGTTIPHLRLLGIKASRGGIVALLEGDCLVEPGWAAAVIKAHEMPDVAIGGAVEPGPYETALDWAVYFCEYGRFMLPLRPQPDLALALAGNNVSYKRALVLEAADEPWGFYDVAIHAAWQAASKPMRADGTIVVRNANTWSLSAVTAVPYHHGRTFAGRRFSGRAGQRLLFGLLAIALPAVKTGRVIIDTVSRGRLVDRLVRALPWIVVFMTSWSVGEMIGYLRGPGDSAARWQ